MVSTSSTRPAHPPRHTLGEVGAWLASARRAARVTGSADLTGISLSSRRVAPGDLYAALPGTRAHGASYAADALAAGAVAVLTDPAGEALLPPGTPRVVVEGVRAVLGEVSARLYDHPAAGLRMIGITGTQGKTTVSRIAEGGLQRAGIAAAVVGTIGTRIDGEDVKTSLTTPEAPDLHALFAVMRERGVEACVMEVSSHALVQGRVDGVVFDVAVFTNLGRDHLDFHRDLEDYFEAKATLFTPERARRALVNADDAYGVRLAERAAIPTRTFSISGRDADWQAVDIVPLPEGSRFVVRGPDGLSVEASCPLPGGYNVANTLAAIAAAAEAGFDAGRVAAGIAASGGVPGRLERVDAGQDFLVVVDYAHKPDAIQAAIDTLRPLTEGRVIVVLGAGGDRDPGKRPLMGDIASRLADVLIVTDDNPRTEDPATIRAAVLAGVVDPRGEVVEIGDRRAAIADALARARTGDVVVIAGKGHETGQEVHGVVHDFDDRVVAAEELGRR